MTCEEFTRWLDDGLPEGAIASMARAHAVDCVRCAAELTTAREIESLLDEIVTRAPAQLTGTVMARIAAIESVRATNPRVIPVSLTPVIGSPLAWWVRAAAQPAAALALALAALTLWQCDVLSSYARVLITNASGWAAGALDARRFASMLALPATVPAADTFARPEVMLGLVFAVAPVMAWASWSLWQWAERRI